MLSKIFLGLSLVGSECVLYFLVALSILSVSLIIERCLFYRQARKDLESFRSRLRKAVEEDDFQTALKLAKDRASHLPADGLDFESQLTLSLLSHGKSAKGDSLEVLSEIAQDSILRARLRWEKNLAILATIGSNAPFIGLFGTVLGIIQAFHDLSQRAGASAQSVTAGVAEALVATAIGILVAIPAVVSFNLFQRRVRSALTEADALKSFMIARMAGR